MKNIKKYLPGVLLSAFVAFLAFFINTLLPIDLFGATLIALVIGMLLNPLVVRYGCMRSGIDWTAKKILRLGIILTGITLSFSQILQTGKYALILMIFTLATSFGVGYICQKVFKINWKLSSLLSVSTAICGGTAVATLGPAIEADDKEIAYAISATFIFDLFTVIAFPWIGYLLGLSDTSFGLWIGTAVNDTSSVVAAGYAFSDVAGALATIVKLTRTLFIVPVVLIFSWIYFRKQAQSAGSNAEKSREKVKLVNIFPWFIVGFLVVVAIKSTGFIPAPAVIGISSLAKLFLAMALAAIGMKTSFNEVAGVGLKPMIAGVIIDTSVVIVSLFAQMLILQFVK